MTQTQTTHRPTHSNSIRLNRWKTAAALLLLPASLASAHTNAPPTRLEEVVVEGREDSLVGIADTAAPT